ncbi:hypothetical protein DFP72DRAFT_924074 [Ephemerocybe angulata]|uniref:Uncharacterized protein n=1 Tax=Ephemerocybe angulata TaxID=980116 RepID=A0A8H6HGJ0_9AGAR|nr:hypothetical protein DFP72DRAFT_924074 [Tulosesus angulatus]
MQLKNSFITILAILQVSFAVGITKRAVCGESCDLVVAADNECRATANYNQCACIPEMLSTLDTCFACLALNIEANEGLNSVLTGGAVTTTGGADAIRARDRSTQPYLVQQCAAAGISLTGTTSGGTTGGTNGGSGTTGGGAASSGTTAGSAATQTPASTGKNGAGTSTVPIGALFLGIAGAVVAL